MIINFNDFLNEKYVNKFDFELGKEYEYDELPEEVKNEIDVQVHDYDESVYDYKYKFVLLKPEETEDYLMNIFNPYDIGDLLETPHMKELKEDILKNGLNYPSVGMEGNHRALIYWDLGLPLPYLDMIKKDNI